MSFLSILVLFGIAALLSAMSAGYDTLSSSHLRHWAKKKDPAAMKLYPLKARGSASYLTIELLRAISLSAAVILLGTTVNGWIAWLIATVIFFFGYVVVTEAYLKPFGLRLLTWFSAPLLAVTNALKFITLPLGRLLDEFISEEPVTLTREELRTMLDSVQQEDTDLSKNDIQILSRALEFSQKTVHELMIPKNKIKSVKESDVLTPIILDELHSTGHSHFPVVAKDKGVIGILHMYDGMDIASHDKTASAIMQKVYFVNEDRGLEHVLEAFYKTKQPVFVVHNQSSDMVGIITMEDVLHQVVGKPIATNHANKVEASSEEATPVVK